MMKKTVLFFAAILAFGCTVVNAKAPKTDKKWKLVWQDQFKGKALDESVWTKIPRNGADWGNYMSDYDSLYSIANGKLTLRAINNHTQTKDTAAFLTGGVYTKDKKAFSNGRVEVYAKLGSAQGFWPAFWLLPATAAWPNGGEIDLMEHLNHEKIVYQTIHTNYTLKHGLKTNPRSGVVPTYNDNDWNLYAVEFYQDSLVFYVNDVKSNTYPRIKTDIEDQFPFADHSFYLLLDAQLGGTWVGPVDPKELPVEMEIDYVKFYEPKKK